MDRAERIARRIRQQLRSRGSPAVARRVQMFFKTQVPAYGWRTAALRAFARRLRRETLFGVGNPLLFAVAEKLFSGPTLEEKGLGVVFLERSVRPSGDTEFRRLESWLRWVDNWAACDSLAGSLLGPMVAADVRRLARPFHWARSKNPWYRRAAAVSLVATARRGLYPADILRLAEQLLADEDEMVQKGVGWLLREAGKARHPGVVRFLLRVKHRAPRLVLRTACEKLPPSTRQRILA